MAPEASVSSSKRRPGDRGAYMGQGDRQNPTRISQQTQQTAPGVQYKYINPQNVSQKSKQNIRAEKMYASRIPSGQQNTNEKQQYLADIMQQNSLNTGSVNQGRLANRHDNGRGGNQAIVQQQSSYSPGPGANQPPLRQIQRHPKYSLSPDPGVDDGNEQEPQQPVFKHVTAQLESGGEMHRNVFQSTQQQQMVSISGNRQAMEAAQKKERAKIRSERSMSSGMSGFSNVSNFGYPMPSNQAMQIKHQESNAGMHGMLVSPQINRASLTQTGANTRGPQPEQHSTSELRSMQEESYSLSRKTNTVPQKRSQHLRKSQPATQQRGNLVALERQQERGFFSPAPQSSAQPANDFRYKPLTPAGFQQTKSVGGRGYLSKFFTHHPQDDPSQGLRSQQNAHMQPDSQLGNANRVIRISDISKQASQSKRQKPTHSVDLDDMDEQETSDIEEYPDEQSYGQSNTQNRNVGKNPFMRQGRQGASNVQNVKFKNYKVPQAKTQKITTSIKPTRGKKPKLTSPKRTMQEATSLNDVKNSAVIKVVKKTNNTRSQKNLLLNEKNLDLKMQKQLRRNLEQRRNALMLKNQRFFDRMSIDNRTQMLIHKLLQDQIDTLVIQASGVDGKGARGQRIRNLILSQQETMNKIMHINQVKTFGQARQIKNRIQGIQAMLEEVDLGPDASNQLNGSLNSSKQSASITDSKMAYQQKLNNTSRPKRDNFLLGPTGANVPKTPEDSQHGLSERQKFQQMAHRERYNHSSNNLQGPQLSYRISENSRNLQIIHEENVNSRENAKGQSAFGVPQDSKGRMGENFDDSYDKYDTFKETPIQEDQKSNNDYSAAILKADDEFSKVVPDAFSQGANDNMHRRNDRVQDQRTYNYARSIDANRNSQQFIAGPASVNSIKSLERTIKSGGGMKGYLNFNNNQNQTPNSNFSRGQSNFSARSGFSQNSPRIGMSHETSAMAQVPGQTLQKTKFIPRNSGQRSSYNQQPHKPSLSSMVQNSLAGQSQPRAQNNNYIKNTAAMRQNISAQNMDLDNIDGQSTIVRGLDDSSGMVITRERVPKTPQTAHLTSNQRRGPSRALNQLGQKLDYDNIMDTEENTNAKQIQSENPVLMQFDDSRRSSRRFQEGQDEYDVPEESNIAQVDERGTFSQGGYSITRDGLRQSMHSQSNMPNAQSLSKSMNKTQISQITSQERKNGRGTLNQSSCNNTTTQMVGRKQNFDVKSFNPYPGSSNQQMIEEREISNIKVQKLSTNSPHEQKVKVMLSARDKNETFNLPGRQFANSPYSNELGAQPVSYASLPQKPQEVTSTTYSPRGANIARQFGSGESEQREDYTLHRANRQVSNGVILSSPRSRTGRVMPQIDIEDEERSIHETLIGPAHLDPHQVSMSKQSDTIQMNERVVSPEGERAFHRQSLSPEGYPSTKRYNIDSSRASGPSSQFLNAKKSINARPVNYEKVLPPHLQINMDDTNTALNDTDQIGEGLKTMPSANRGQGLPMGANRAGNIGPFGPGGLAGGAHCCQCKNQRTFSNANSKSARALSPNNIPDMPLSMKNQNRRDLPATSRSPTGSISKRSKRNTVNSRGDSEDEYNISMSQNSARNRRKSRNENEGIGRYGINGHEICGQYCMHLTPDQERALILELIRSNIADYLNPKNVYSNQKAIPSNNIVSDADMAKYAKSNNSLNLMTASENDKRYLICANWWRDWCDYANFDLSQLSLVNKEFTTRTRKGTGDSKFSNMTGAAHTITGKQESFGSRGSLDRKPKFGLGNRNTLGAINEQRNQAPFGEQPYENEEDSIRVDSEVKNLFTHPKQSQVSQSSRRSRRSRGDSALKGSVNFGQTTSKVTIDSEKQREFDFRAELQNLKNKKKIEKQQMRVEETDSQSGSPRSKLNRPQSSNAAYPQSSRQHMSSQVTGRGHQNIYYKRPQTIQNCQLLKDLNAYMLQRGKGTPQTQQMSNMYLFLKEDLIEHFDFEAVNIEIWRFFKSWYDCDLQLLRFIKKDNVNRNQLFLDLYPEKRVAQGQVNQN